MGRIRVLPDRLIDRIAAGEVVERPASVVKELVENALDAGGRSIDVALRSGGRRLIRVRDDGSGMDRDDALLALERHATSKLDVKSDLLAISTLGFRGEALSSIAAVSAFTLETAREDGVGTRVEVRGGKIGSVREVGLPRGTSIHVERLFFNVPARRKFLKTESTELSHAARLVTRYALAFPAIRFRLEHAAREVLRADPVDRLIDRVAQTHGASMVDRLLPVDLEAAGIRVTGLVGKPSEGMPRRDAQHLFVNHRAVQDRVLLHAVSEAYGNTMPRGRFPIAFLFVELEPQRVDVNVHPQKTEVRFREAGAVHDVVREAIRAAMSAADFVPRIEELRPQWGGAERSGVARRAASCVDSRQASSAPGSDSTTVGERPADDPPLRPAGAAARPETADLVDLIHDSDPATPVRVAVPLAQYRDSYILAEDRQGLVLVDQHAAHERVIFERYLEDAEQNRVEVQKLLFPKVVELTAQERILLEQEADEFERLGFTLESFGGNSVRIGGVPALTAESDPEDVLRELLGEAGQARAAAANVERLRHRLVTTAACHAAIKVNYPLTRDTMQALLDDLYQTENPGTCPHGRPALFRLTLDEIERTFGRR